MKSVGRKNSLHLQSTNLQVDQKANYLKLIAERFLNFFFFPPLPIFFRQNGGNIWKK